MGPGATRVGLYAHARSQTKHHARQSGKPHAVHRSRARTTEYVLDVDDSARVSLLLLCSLVDSFDCIIVHRAQGCYLWHYVWL